MSFEEDFTSEIKEEEKIDKELKKFNWGAFLGSWIWGIGNKNFLICIPVLILSLIPALLFKIIAFGYSIWLGTQGNKWAWENGKYTDLERFKKVQKNWAIAGLVIFLLPIAYNLILLNSFINTSKNITQEQRIGIADSRYCLYGGSIAKKALKQSNLDNQNFEEDFLRNIENYNNLGIGYYVNKVEENNGHYTLSVIVVNNKMEPTEYIMEFDLVKNQNCAISEGNCYINVKLSENSNNTCRLYFDQNGTTVRSKKTNDYLNKLKDKDSAIYKAMKVYNAEKAFVQLVDSL